MPEITMMGEQNGWSTDETIEQLQAYYDGYHFSRKNMVDVFNPFSLINALSDNELRNYWLHLVQPRSYPSLWMIWISV